VLLLLAVAPGALAQPVPSKRDLAKSSGSPSKGEAGVQLDFDNVDLPVVIDTIARLTGKNFIYDENVRGKVTIVSPTRISIPEAYAVFESVLRVKGYTTVEGPAGVLKVVPLGQARKRNLPLLQGKTPTPKSDRFVTRLIPLRYIDAEAITATLKPLVSQEASMVAYEPTNTVILTDAAFNISRILKILRAIDIETYKSELTVIQVKHADASTLAEQLSEIYEADVSSSAVARRRALRTRARPVPLPVSGARRGRIRIITDQRTNSLIVLAPRQRLDEVRRTVARLDVAVTGGGRIHVHYLRNADAEALAATLTSLISGQPAAGTAGTAPGQANVQAMRAAISAISAGVTITADPPTNSLVIQASQEGYKTLAGVIDQLDIQRPQVLVEALIMEVDVSDQQDLGFSGLVGITANGNQYKIGSLTDSRLNTFLTNNQGGGTATTPTPTPLPTSPTDLSTILAALAGSTPQGLIAAGAVKAGSTLIQGVIRASAGLKGTNIVSAPHVLTVDNEEAEIKVGNNIPIPTSRVQSAQGIAGSSLATSTNIERQDIGVTLRVTPQISEGDHLRLKIFQEIKNVNAALTLVTGNPQDVGVALSNRTVTNTVVVKDEETVVIGGLISDDYEDSTTKVPFLGDIPVLGWLFKTTSHKLLKTNLLIFITPHIIRDSADMEYASILKREEFWDRSKEGLQLTKKEAEEQDKRRAAAKKAGVEFEPMHGANPVRSRMLDLEKHYPLERMRALEEERKRRKGMPNEPKSSSAPATSTRYGILAGTFGDPSAARDMLQQLIDAGFDGTLVSGDHGGTVLYEVRLGPYESLEDADKAKARLRESFDLAPGVFVENADADSEAP